MHGTSAIVRRGAGMRLVAWCLALVCLAAPAPHAAAMQAGAEQGSIGGAGGGHGWNTVRTGPDRRPAVVHLPPRTGPNAVARGTVRFASWLIEEPAWVGTWDNRIYLAFAADGLGIDTVRRHVVSMSAMPLVAGLWENHPAGRFRTLPAMPGDGDLAGFIGSASGPIALIRNSAEAEAPPRWRVLVLRGNDWLRVPMPWDSGDTSAPVEGDHVQLVAMPGGPAITVVQSSGEAMFHAARIGTPRDGTATAQWQSQVIRGISDPGFGTMVGLEGRLLRHRHIDGAGLVLELVRPGDGGGVYEVARYSDVPPEAKVIPMHGSGTLALMWTAVDATDGSPRGYELREVSALSGRVWYSGAGGSGGLVQTRQFQILAVVLIVLMATVLLFILRPGDQTAKLPSGMAVAEPSRRIAAAGADFLLGVLLASALTGTGGSEMLSPTVLLGSADAAGALLLAFWLTFCHTTAGEWLFGRSLGKSMAGCEVVRVERIAVPAAAMGAGAESTDASASSPDAATGSPIPDVGPAVAATQERPLLWQAVARNAVRWGLPPLGLWLLADPSGRHPGDLLARTVVVVRGPQEEVPSDSGAKRGDRGEG